MADRYQTGGQSESTQPSQCCVVQVSQAGFLKLLVAILASFCFTLGTFLAILHVHSLVEDSDLSQEIKVLRDLVRDTEAKVSESGTKDLKALEERLSATEKELEKLKSEVQLLEKQNQGDSKPLEEGPKVAFSASLVPSGEFHWKQQDSPTLVYKRIFTNTGNAYDFNTGIFTAPVQGIYFFSFSTFGYTNFLSGAILTKNGERMVSSYDSAATGDSNDTGGNSVILQLEAGEQVSMKLWENSEVYDNSNGHNTFSGFLLFPL